MKYIKFVFNIILILYQNYSCAHAIIYVFAEQRAMYFDYFIKTKRDNLTILSRARLSPHFIIALLEAERNSD